MLSVEYKNLISQLSNLTTSDKIAWNKYDSSNSFFCQTDGRKIVVDKYFSKKEDKEITCINLTILKDNDDVLEELVYCNNVNDLSDFDIFKDLHKIVETKYLDININSELKKISESLPH